LPKEEAGHRLIVNTTQPLFEYNGVLRWALNNVAHTKNPTCEVMAGGCVGAYVAPDARELARAMVAIAGRWWR
jgi:hypothetical protein